MDRPNPGITFALSARFHCVAKAPISQNVTEGAKHGYEVYVRVVSHQFDREWNLVFAVGSDGSALEASPCDNTFVATAVHYALLEALQLNVLHKIATTESSPLILSLYADNAFYSQVEYLRKTGKVVSLETLQEVPKFNKIVGTLAKTGLGSSACLVTSVVAATLGVFGTHSADRVHTIAQIAHCEAQGKIGSGFDVASAVYGSCQYVRFSPSAISSVIDGASSRKLCASLTDLPLVNSEVSPFRLPSGITLSLADINKGSSTPGMVASVFKWKAAREEAGDSSLWADLSEANANVAECIRGLVKLEEENAEEYHEVKALLDVLPAKEWKGDSEVARQFIKVRDAFAVARVLLKRMGVEAGVEIEPDQQTTLLEATLQGDGVLAAGCPGAGGYDAIFALTLSEASREALAKTWQGFESVEHDVTKGTVCALAVSQDTKAGLDVVEYANSEEAGALYPGL